MVLINEGGMAAVLYIMILNGAIRRLQTNAEKTPLYPIRATSFVSIVLYLILVLSFLFINLYFLYYSRCYCSYLC